MFSLKIFSDDKPTLRADILEYVANNSLGLEFGFYQKSEPINILTVLDNEDYQKINKSNLIWHLDYNKVVGYRINDTDVHNNIINEITIGLKLGISKYIIHYHHTSLPSQEFLKINISERLSRLSEVANQFGVTLYIENTAFQNRPANPEFYRMMFGHMMENNLNGFGFCFDIGHGKVFSDNNVFEWLGFVSYIQKFFPIHFHLHNNDGVDDRHYSYKRAEDLKLNIEDKYTLGHHHLHLVKYIQENYGGMKTLEIGSKGAIEHHRWLKERLNSIQDIQAVRDTAIKYRGL